MLRTATCQRRSMVVRPVGIPGVGAGDTLEAGLGHRCCPSPKLPEPGLVLDRFTVTSDPSHRGGLFRDFIRPPIPLSVGRQATHHRQHNTCDNGDTDERSRSPTVNRSDPNKETRPRTNGPVAAVVRSLADPWSEVGVPALASGSGLLLLRHSVHSSARIGLAPSYQLGLPFPPTQSRGLTTRTGASEWRTMRSATLPITSRPNPPRPWLAITTSVGRRAAWSITAWAGLSWMQVQGFHLVGFGSFSGQPMLHPAPGNRLPLPRRPSSTPPPMTQGECPAALARPARRLL